MIQTVRPGASYYTARPEDEQAVYLTPNCFAVAGDGIADDSDALQRAIDSIPYGIVFVPEGRYRISRTIYVPKAVRLIGYGEKRPTIVLGPNTPGFQNADSGDKRGIRSLLWFVDRRPVPGQPIADANPGTFYSALSNVNVEIGDGNPAAVALRTHYAQHGFIAHCDLYIGEGKAGIFDADNEIEDVRFFGGEYGIYTTKPSPGWPFLAVDTYFEGQRRAAIRSREGGLTLIRMEAHRVPTVIETDADFVEKLFLEDGRFDEISGPAVIVSNENNAHNQINLINVDCREVPVLASFRQSGRQLAGNGAHYRVAAFRHGSQMKDIDARAAVSTVLEWGRPDAETNSGADSRPAVLPASDLPAVPPGAEWVNAKALGAAGDSVTDDTAALQAAIDGHRTVYLPQGFYRLSETLRLGPDTVLIGLNPITTQLVLPDNAEAFGGLGSPKALVETASGGCTVLAGVAIDNGGRNPRAVGCKWMAGAESYMNDVKFLGGHGGLSPEGDFLPVYNANRTADIDPDRRWDSQYWSLWVTDGGGGSFKDIWTASPYAAAGLHVSETDTEERIYAVSVEHHVRREVQFHNAANWRIYALQMEEEAAESKDCLPLELIGCSRLRFANTYFFRTIWLDTPSPWAIRTWHCQELEFFGLHN